VRPIEVVFDEPLGKPPVELGGAHDRVAHLGEFFGERPVEAFFRSIVLLRPRAGAVMRQGEGFCGLVEEPMELAAVVSLDVFDPAAHEKMEGMEKIGRGPGRMLFIHVGKG
jgi:hypothetical protein